MATLPQRRSPALAKGRAARLRLRLQLQQVSPQAGADLRQGLTAAHPAVSSCFFSLPSAANLRFVQAARSIGTPGSKELFMLAIAKPYVAPDAMEATVNYFPKRGLTQGINSARSEEVAGSAPDARQVIMHNGRLGPSEFALDCHGFCFVRHIAKIVDFFDSEEVRRVHYPEVEALVRAKTGASRVFVFEHKLRTTDVGLREAGKVHGIVRKVHNDYTESSGRECLRFHLPQEADALLQHRFAIVQVWRPIRGPVEAFPLGVCDARSLSIADLVMSERSFAGGVGQSYSISYNPDHRWYWFPCMRCDEALVFKVYDSLNDGRARWTPHTAFEDPTSLVDAQPRQCIQIRTFAFF
jgi:hypothetical protein